MGKSSENSSSSGGIGFWGLLQIAFIVLKLCGLIDWPWLWVLAPAWIGALILVVFLAVAFIIAWRTA